MKIKKIILAVLVLFNVLNVNADFSEEKLNFFKEIIEQKVYDVDGEPAYYINKLPMHKYLCDDLQSEVDDVILDEEDIIYFQNLIDELLKIQEERELTVKELEDLKYYQVTLPEIKESLKTNLEELEKAKKEPSFILTMDITSPFYKDDKLKKQFLDKFVALGFGSRNTTFHEMVVVTEYACKLTL